MPGATFTLIRLAGIPIRIHWTFFLLLVWVGGSTLFRGGSAAAALWSIFFVCAVFLCVTLHELGHATAARAYGVRTRDILLLPIGGVASLEKLPEKPLHEFVIAVAGPLVNVVIAGALLGALAWRVGLSVVMSGDSLELDAEHFLVSLAVVNVWLVLFNMIPAFPMDGGRVLRAILSAMTDRVRATRIAARVGQVVAVLMAIVGVFYAPLLLLIALFVWFGAAAEARAVEATALLKGQPVSAAMLRMFSVLGERATIDEASRQLLAGSPQDFPVTRDGTRDSPIVGVLTRDDLASALQSRDPSTPVSEVMRAPPTPMRDTEPLERALEFLQASGSTLLPVVDTFGRVIGLLTIENVAQLLRLRAAAAAAKSRRRPIV